MPDLNTIIAAVAIVVGGAVAIVAAIMGGYYMRRNRREESEARIERDIGKVEGELSAGRRRSGNTEEPMPYLVGVIRGELTGFQAEIRSDIADLRGVFQRTMESYRDQAKAEHVRLDSRVSTLSRDVTGLRRLLTRVKKETPK